MSERTDAIAAAFATDDVAARRAALARVGELSPLDREEAVALAVAFSTVFYLEHADDPDLDRLVHEVESAIVGLGPDALDPMLASLADADPESAEHLARVIGSFGATGVGRVVAELVRHADDRYALTHLLLALGHVEDPSAAAAVPKVVSLASSDDPQLRAAAVYCLGRIVRRVEASDVDPEVRAQMFDAAFAARADVKALVRRHAIRALGKMENRGYLTQVQRDHLVRALRAVLGYGNFEWDDAFIVRNEAERLLRECPGLGNLQES